MNIIRAPPAKLMLRARKMRGGGFVRGALGRSTRASLWYDGVCGALPGSLGTAGVHLSGKHVGSARESGIHPLGWPLCLRRSVHT